DDERGDVLWAQDLQKEFGDTAQRSIPADGDGGQCGFALHPRGIDLGDAVEEELDVDLACGQTRTELVCDGSAAATACNGIGEDQDAHDGMLTVDHGASQRDPGPRLYAGVVRSFSALATSLSSLTGLLKYSLTPRLSAYIL